MPRPTCNTLAATLAAAIVTSQALAQIELVADIRIGSPTTPNYTSPLGPFGILPTASGPLALFPALAPNYGRVLWKSDGTPSGTSLVRDFSTENYLAQNPREFTLFNNRIFFTANLNSSSDLWLCSSDGTSCGTQLHFRLYHDAGSNTTAKLTVMGNWLYYVGYAPSGNSSGIELYRTDGTIANTTLVADLSPGLASTSVVSMATNGAVLFLAAAAAGQSPSIGNELWICDGTSFTSVDIAAGAASSNPASLTILNDNCYFSASTLANGNELWKSNGTANGTMIAADIMPGSGSSSPTNLTVHAGKLYFSAVGRDQNNANIGNELFIFDGSAAALVADLLPGTASSNPSRVVSHGPDAYFAASDAQAIPRLYRTRGTASTTVPIVPSLRLNLIQGGATVDMASTTNGLVFRAQPNSQTPFSLWVTNGQPDHAVNISAVYPNGSTTSGTSAFMTPMGDGRVIFGGGLVFTYFDAWITDGSPLGTFQLRDPFQVQQSSFPQTFAPWQNQLAFRATVSGAAPEYYLTGGTPDSTRLLFDPAMTGTERNISTLTPWAGGAALIAALSANDPAQIINFATPASPPQVLCDLAATNLIPINDVLLATAFGGAYQELYRVPQTGGTPQLLDPVNRPRSVSSGTAVQWNQWLYFAGQRDTDTNAFWLWKTDGINTIPIVRLGNAEDYVESVSRVVRADNRLFMRITGSASGTELWTSDGTPQGTHIVTDLNPGIASALGSFDLSNSGVIGHRLVFRANHPALGIEYFISDGTPQGTYCLGDLNPGSAHGAASPSTSVMQVVGQMIFVAGTSPEFGTELWMSDGSPNSLTRITDFFPGPESSNPSRFTTDGEKLYFVAEGCSTGKELYSADTSGSVLLLAETAAGPEHGAIQNTYWFNGSLYFTYNHPTFGRELFRIRTAPCPSDFNADSIVDLFDYLDFVSAFAASEPAADFNADTIIDFFDYLDFVEAFAAGC